MAEEEKKGERVCSVFLANLWYGQPGGARLSSRMAALARNASVTPFPHPNHQHFPHCYTEAVGRPDLGSAAFQAGSGKAANCAHPHPF